MAALRPHVPLLLGATALSLAVEGVLLRWQRGILSAFAKSHADITVRHVLRDLLLVVCLLRLGEQHREPVYTPLIAGLLAFYVLHCAIQAVSVLVRRTRTLPVVTRNIDAAALRLSPAPPILLRRPGPRLLIFGLPATAGLLATAAADDPAARPWASHSPWASPCWACTTFSYGCCRAVARRVSGRPWSGSTPGWRSTGRPSGSTSPAARPRRTRRTCGWSRSRSWTAGR